MKENTLDIAIKMRRSACYYKDISKQLKVPMDWCERNLIDVEITAVIPPTIAADLDHLLYDYQEINLKEEGYFVYEFYQDDLLLYVGSTICLYDRFSKHGRSTKAYKQANLIRVHRAESLPEMLFVEAQKILLEKPLWNVQYQHKEMKSSAVQVNYELYLEMRKR